MNKEAGLSKSQREILKNIREAFYNATSPKINRQSDLCKDQEFADYFSNLFSVYHTITEEKFEKKSFEFAFKYASIAAGHRCDIIKNSSNPGEDVVRNNERFSLKTQGGKSQPKSSITMSKFFEARFIAKYKTEVEERRIKGLPNSDPSKQSQLRELEKRKANELREGVAKDFIETFRHHIACYERIVVLKAQEYRNESDDVEQYHYRIIEVPKKLLNLALSLSRNDFSVPRGSGGATAHVRLNQGKEAYTITLDGSVEKVTISGIPIDQCITHAEFHVRVTV